MVEPEAEELRTTELNLLMMRNGFMKIHNNNNNNNNNINTKVLRMVLSNPLIKTFYSMYQLHARISRTIQTQ